MKAFPFRMKTLAVAAPLAGILAAGCWNNNDNGTNPSSQFPLASSAASAQVRGYTDSAIRGTVTFKELGDSLLVQGNVSGLTPGKQYAVHVHQFGNCVAPESSGEHLGAPLEMHGNPFDSAGMHHRGDLPNLQVDSNGVGHFELLTGEINLNMVSNVNGRPMLDTGSTRAQDSLALKDTVTAASRSRTRSVIGRSVVVHALPDDYLTQPAGGSDGRIACGVIGPATSGLTVDTTGTGLDTTKVKTDTTKAKTDTIPIMLPVDTTNKNPKY